MWLFSLLLLLLLPPGPLSSCPDHVTAPKELVVASGSCLYIPCRYSLCEAGSKAQLKQLQWLHQPTYNREQKKWEGGQVTDLLPSSATNAGECHLVLPRLEAGAGGVYGLRLGALPTKPGFKELRWMHQVNVTVIGTLPAPHLWPDPAPLIEGLKATFGCWVPPACPEEAPKLIWEGHVTGAPRVTMGRWTPPPTVTHFPGVGTALTFEPLWHHDGTVLSCSALGVDGRTSRVSQTLQVNYAPREVRVEMVPPFPVYEGDKLTLSCRDSANPPSEHYEWSLEGRPLPHQGAQLLLRPVKAADAGSYRCRAANRVGTTESLPATLEVYYAPQDVWVEATPPSPALEGREVTLSCRNSANPAPSHYGWSLEGRPLPHQGAQLLLRPVKAADAGSYRCRATNRVGTTESLPATLEVYYPPRSAAVEPQAPLPALAGAQVALRCALGPARGPAPPAVQWQRLEEGAWRDHALGPALSFRADPARAGSYRCIGRNAAGSAPSPPLQLIVWYPPGSARIQQLPPGPVRAGEGPVRLRCRAGPASPPELEVTWYKSGRALPGHAPELLLPRPHAADWAAYECHAQNAVGGARSPPHTLDVRFSPQGVELVASPGPRVQEATDVTLSCGAASRPPPDAFEWFRDGRPLGRGPAPSWLLPAVGAHQGGAFRCRARNELGAADSPELVLTVYYSTSTILRRTFLGLGLGLGLLLLSGALGCFLRHRWRRQVAADEEPVVEPPRTFFLCNKKPQAPGSPRPSRGGDDVISYAALMSPPGGGSAPRLRGDTVVYTVLKRNDGGHQATEGPDYENVPAGATGAAGDGEGTLVYAALALSSPRPPRGHHGDLGDTVEYVALRR